MKLPKKIVLICQHTLHLFELTIYFVEKVFVCEGQFCLLHADKQWIDLLFSQLFLCSLVHKFPSNSKEGRNWAIDFQPDWSRALHIYSPHSQVLVSTFISYQCTVNSVKCRVVAKQAANVNM